MDPIFTLLGLLDDAVTVFDIQGDGTLLFRESLSPAGLDGASGVVVSPDGLNVYLTARTDDALMVFDRAGDGSLSFLETFFKMTPSHPRRPVPRW